MSEHSNTRFDFPTVRFNEKEVYFNYKSREILDSERLNVSKSGDYIVFRPARDNSGLKTYGTGGGFHIKASKLRGAFGIQKGSMFRLYPIKDGGAAIKRYEPL